MSLRNIAVLGTVAVLIIAYVAWTRNTQKPAPGVMPQQVAPSAGEPAAGGDGAGTMPPSAAAPEAQPPVIETATNPGLAWKVPAGWTDKGASSMRLATYVFQGPNNTEATCAVYYFGPSQGGTVEANLERWQGEFKDAKPPARSKLSANGIGVERISLSGTYMAHVGMMGSGSSTESPNWALLGAIAEGPNGSVFFKFTGPESAVKAAGGAFEAMLKSIHKA
jgi:hypothetical protein